MPSRPHARPRSNNTKVGVDWHNRRNTSPVRAANLMVSYLVGVGDWDEESHARMRRYARERFPFGEPTNAAKDAFGVAAHFLRGTFNTQVGIR